MKMQFLTPFLVKFRILIFFQIIKYFKQVVILCVKSVMGLNSIILYVVFDVIGATQYMYVPFSHVLCTVLNLKTFPGNFLFENVANID